MENPDTNRDPFRGFVQVHVTQAHIDQGTKADCALCPVAQAIAETTGMTVTVGDDVCHVTRPAREGELGNSIGLVGKTFYLPDSAVNFIYRFDRDYPVQPFSFWLEH